MRTVFFGTPEFAAVCLTALASRHEVVAVVTQPDQPKGRGQETAAPAVKETARKLSLPVLQPASVRKPPFAPELARLAPEIAVVVAYGKILPPDLLAVPKRGCINVHASLLPRWRGAAPIQWALLAGDERTGITVMQLDAGMDTGPMLSRWPLEKDLSTMTASTLSPALAELGARALLETLAGLEKGTVIPEPQDDSKATHARLLTKEDGRIDWKKPAAEIERQVRAFDLWPGTFTTAGGKILKVHRVQTGVGVAGASPGQVLGLEGGAVKIATGDGSLLFFEVQPEGKKRMSAAEWQRGHRLERLG